MDNLNVAFLPVYPNPYQRLLADALRPLGVTVRNLAEAPSRGRLQAMRSELAVLHLHWLYGLYMNRLGTPRRLARFLGSLRAARELGYRMVWTAHNLLPHRSTPRLLHLYVRRLIMAQADAVIAHCEYGRRALLQRFNRRGPVYVIPIGSYAGVYPISRTRAIARERLGIPDESFVYLFLGNIEAYKGLDVFVGAFQAQATPEDIALIAGRNRDEALVRRLAQQAGRDARLRLHAGFIPDEDMQDFLLSADVMVAPFSQVLTSSSVIVGLSYGLPVIVPDLGCLPELVASEAGIVYEAGDRSALAEALRLIKTSDLPAMGEAARRISENLDWSDIARRTLAVYRSVLA